MERDNEEQLHRLRNREKSDAAKLAWKRHHSNYMRSVRERERNMENKTFYSIAKELGKRINEEKIVRDNVFEKELDLCFDTIAGGFSMSINKDKNLISFSCSLNEQGSGQYGLTIESDEEINSLYTQLKEDLQNICKMVDDEMKQVLSKHGLKSTF